MRPESRRLWRSASCSWRRSCSRAAAGAAATQPSWLPARNGGSLPMEGASGSDNLTRSSTDRDAARPAPPDRRRPRGLRRAGPRRLARGDRAPRRRRDRDALPHFPDPRRARRGDLRRAHRRGRRGGRGGRRGRGRLGGARLASSSACSSSRPATCRSATCSCGPGGRSGTSPSAAGRFAPLLDRLVDRAREQGALRDDFTVADLSLAMWSFAPMFEATTEIAPQAWRRHCGSCSTACGPRPRRRRRPAAHRPAARARRRGAPQPYHRKRAAA